MDLDAATKMALKDGISANKDFYVSDNLYQVAIAQTKTRTPGGNTLDEDISLIRESGMIDDFEYNGLLALQKASEANYNGELSLGEFQVIVDDMIEQWTQQGYDENSGAVLAVSLAISQSSIEWWLENPDASSGTRALPAWLGADIAGAVIGAAVVAAKQIGADEFSWAQVGDGALAGAVVGSTGAVPKLGKWIQSLF